jgi:hypothetical protein
MPSSIAEHSVLLEAWQTMDSSLYTRAQRAMAELKGTVYELLTTANTGLSNAEIGRRLGIYQGHIGHEGHISRTILSLLEAEQVVVQDKESKLWSIRRPPDLSS